MYRFEVYQDKVGEYRFRLKASNGETMFISEGYSVKASAFKSIDLIKKNPARRLKTRPSRRFEFTVNL